MTNDDEGEGGVTIPPKIDDVIYEQPLTSQSVPCFQIHKELIFSGAFSLINFFAIFVYLMGSFIGFPLMHLSYGKYMHFAFRPAQNRHQRGSRNSAWIHSLPLIFVVNV